MITEQNIANVGLGALVATGGLLIEMGLFSRDAAIRETSNNYPEEEPTGSHKQSKLLDRIKQLTPFNLGTTLINKSQSLTKPGDSFVATILPFTGFVAGLTMRLTGRCINLGATLGADLCKLAANKCKEAYTSALEPSQEFTEETNLLSHQSSVVESEQQELREKEEAITSVFNLARTLAKEDCILIDKSKKIALKAALDIDQMDGTLSPSLFSYSQEAIETILKTVQEVLDSEKTKNDLSDFLNRKTLHQRLIVKLECQEKRLSKLDDEFQKETKALSAYTEELNSLIQEEAAEAASLEDVIKQTELFLNTESLSTEDCSG